MSSDYNGWTNYETWRMELELCSDMAEEWRREGIKFDSIGDLRDAFRDCVEDVFGEQGLDGLVYHWAMVAAAAVNWWEIAKAHEDELVRAGDADDEEDGDDE